MRISNIVIESDLFGRTPTTEVFNLLVNGKLWKKDGKPVEFKNIESAYKARDTIIARYNKPAQVFSSQKPIKEEIDPTGSPRVRKVEQERPDGSIDITFEVLNSDGVTVASGMSYETAVSYLRNHYYDL